MPEYVAARERRRFEDFRRIGTDIVVGRVSIDPEICRGCALCASVCPASVLEVVGKKSRMVAGEPICFSCGCCTAICPEGAITLTEFLELRGAFRYLDRGRPEPPRRF